jgi:drug/metabolite transporter (DMT)-like permease
MIFCFWKTYISLAVATLSNGFNMSAVIFGEFAALGAAISWAVAPILYRRALFKTKPMSANIVRCASNAAVLMFILLALGKAGALASLPMEVIIITVASGVVGLGIGDTLYMFGLRSVGVARAVPLAASYPLFSLVWATMLGEPVTVTAVSGAFVILLGIWLLSRDKENSIAGIKDNLALKGIIVSLATAVVWSVSITLMDVAVTMPGVNSIDASYAIITTRIAAMAVFMIALSPVLDRDHGFLKMKRCTLIELCIGGLVANGVGWLLMNYSFLNILEAQAVPISSTTPLFSTIAGFALFHEKMTANNTLGAIVVVAGIFLIFMI